MVQKPLFVFYFHSFVILKVFLLLILLLKLIIFKINELNFF